MQEIAGKTKLKRDNYESMRGEHDKANSEYD